MKGTERQMKLVDYEDDMGRKFKVSLPDDVPDVEAEFGNALGPPLLDSLHLPHDMMVKLHNFLFDMNIYTAKQAQMNRQHITSAIQRICGLHTESIIQLYGSVEKPEVVATISMPQQGTTSTSRITAKRRR
jgi:hypothetical protein